jgi:hypothetical protein
MTDKEIDRIIKANIKMAGFISLVKRMREAQKSFDALSLDQELEIDIQGDIVDSLEREVDEYLKKMEYGVDKSK